MKRLVILLSLPCLLSFSMTLGCATQETVSACKSVDWYEMGRRDGSLGRTQEAFEKHRSECQREANTSFEAMYMNGRDRGLIEFCTPDNGFVLGKTGEIYYYVCPFHLEGLFLSEYKRGQRVLALQRENLRLDQKISSLFGELRNPGSFERRDSLQEELSSLRNARTKNDQELSKIETGSKSVR